MWPSYQSAIIKLIKKAKMPSLTLLLILTTAVQLSSTVTTCGETRNYQTDCNDTFVQSYGTNTCNGRKVLDYLSAQEKFMDKKFLNLTRVSN